MKTMTKTTVRQAAEMLLSVCDGAYRQDGQGFNRYDADFVRKLMNTADWTVKQEGAVYKTLQKYAKQLRSLGVEYGEIKQVATRVSNLNQQKDAEQKQAMAENSDSINDLLQRLNWSAPKIVFVRSTNSEMSVETATVPGSAFWGIYRDNKETLKRDYGVSVKKADSGEWIVTRWLTVADEKGAKKNGTIKVKRVSHKGLLPYQPVHVKKLVEAMLNNGSALDGSVTGSGKTPCALAVSRELKLKVFVVCPKSARPVWRRWANHIGADLIDAVNYERLRTGNSVVEIIGGKKKFMTWMLNPDDTMIIFDEVHKCKGRKTQNSELLVSAREQGFKLLMLSATVADNPTNFRAIGFALGLFPKVRYFYSWSREYGCGQGKFGFEFTGGKKDMQKLHEAIYGAGIGARMGDDVLPPEQIVAQTYEMTNEEVIKKIYGEMQEQLIELKNRSLTDDQDSAVTILLRARQAVELLKVPDLVEMVKDLVESGYSVPIFVNFNQTLDALKEKLGTECVVRGEQKQEERDTNINNFQSDREPIIICNIASGGAVISLHDLNGNRPRRSVILPTWSAQDLVQTFGRIRRSGALTSIIQYIVYAADTVEEQVCERVQEKINRIRTLNDGDLAEPLKI